LYQHRTGVFKDSFTSRYNISKLVYFEYFLTIEDAIQREKQLKLAQDKKRLN
jgi:putative endonuclease